jgi:hypothetical protein
MTAQWFAFEVRSGGALIAGLTPDFVSFAAVAESSEITPQPAIVEVGGGVYKFLYDISVAGAATWAIDAGQSIASVADRFIVGASSAPAIPDTSAAVRVRLPARDCVLADFSALENRVRTFNLIQVLDAGDDDTAAETIVEVESATLEAIAPDGADGTPNARIAGPAGIDGALVAVPLGNWQVGDGVPDIQYRLTVRVSTTRLADIAVFGTFWVRQA